MQAICDTDLPKARALADRFGVKDAFDDIEELLRYEALDAVVICSPNHLHESHILAALSANLHVLVEKPLAMSATSVQRILRAVEKHDRVVMVGMNHRYRPDVQIVRSFVQSGELGTIESVRGSWHVFRPGPTPAGLAPAAGPGRRRRDARSGALDSRSGPLAGRQLAAGTGQRQPRPGRKGPRGGAVGQRVRGLRERNVDLRRRHLAAPGRRASASASGLRGSKGTAGINPLNVWKELHGVAVDVSPTGSVSRENAFTASYRAEWAHFQAAIAGEAKIPSLQEHLTLHKVLDAIYRSALDGRDVEL